MPIISPTTSLRHVKPPSSALVINDNHPLGSGLVFSPVFSEGQGASVYDPARQQVYTFGTNVTWTRGPHGPAMVFPGGANQEATGSGLFLKAPITVSAKFNTPVNEAHIMFGNGDTGADDKTFLYGDEFGSYQLHVEMWFDFINFNNDAAIHQNVWNHNHFTMSAAGVGTWYWNGKQVDSQTFAGPLDTTAGNGAWGMGGRTTNVGGGSTSHYNGYIDHFMIWNRVLTPGEIVEHIVDPYLMFQSPIVRQWDAGAAAPMPPGLGPVEPFDPIMAAVQAAMMR